MALLLVETWGAWVFVIGNHALPAFAVAVVLPLLIAPISVSSLLLHELGWIAGFAYVAINYSSRLNFEWLQSLPGFVPEPPSIERVEDFDSLFDLTIHFLKPFLRPPPPMLSAQVDLV